MLKSNLLSLKNVKIIACSAIAVISISSCKKKSDEAGPVITETSNETKGKPSWGPTITSDMLAVINKLDSLQTAPLIKLSPQEVRKQASPTDAVMALMMKRGIPKPVPALDTMGKNIPVDGGNIHLRIYTPKGAGPFPVIVYYHGGGWVIANLDTYDASAATLAEKSNAVLVSVAYRQGPEYKFPTAHKDSYAAYKWVVNNAASIKGNPSKIAVAGESAGGNLAVAVSMMARDSSFAKPVHQLVVYPIAGYDTTTESYTKYADAKPLSRPLMSWFFKYYLNNSGEGSNKLISLYNADLRNLPPATIICAEIDPLQSDGQKLANKFNADGVAATYKIYTGVTHEFFGMATIIPEAIQAQEQAVTALKAAFNK